PPGRPMSCVTRPRERIRRRGGGAGRDRGAGGGTAVTPLPGRTGRNAFEGERTPRVSSVLLQPAVPPGRRDPPGAPAAATLWAAHWRCSRARASGGSACRSALAAPAPLRSLRRALVAFAGRLRPPPAAPPLVIHRGAIRCWRGRPGRPTW